LGFGLFALSCGDDEGDGAATEAPTSAASEEATSAPSGEAIKLGFSAWPGWFPWQVAEEAGIFDDVGVNVDLVWFEGYLDSINAFTAGQLDANSQTLNDTLGSVAAGSDQRIVLVNDNSTGNDQVIVAEGIDTIQDLAGKRIGVEEGVVDHFLLAQGLESVGMSLDDVEIVNLETGAAAAAFAAGQLDAVAVFAPFTTSALARQGSKALFTSADFPGSIPDHLVVSGELVDQRPDDVQKLIEAWYKTLDYIEQNPDEAAQIMAERAGVTVDEYATYEAGTTIFSLEDNLTAFAPGADNTSLQYAAQQIGQFMVDTAFIDAVPDLTKLLNSTFVQAYSDSQ
jgi:NitT/TauT family transport system substrate-binding protein